MTSVEQLASKLKATQEFTSAVEKYLDENFLIEGKTTRQWKGKFFIKIPSEITFPTVVNLATQIWNNFQEASYYRDKQITQLAIMEQTKLDKYNEAYQVARMQSVKDHGKPMAAESCKIEAIIVVQDLENAINNQKVVKDFWVKTCQTLTEMRKLLEIIGHALAGDSRVSRDFVIKTGERK